VSREEGRAWSSSLSLSHWMSFTSLRLPSALSAHWPEDMTEFTRREHAQNRYLFICEGISLVTQTTHGHQSESDLQEGDAHVLEKCNS
jgi:hypothetical protein